MYYRSYLLNFFHTCVRVALLTKNIITLFISIPCVILRSSKIDFRTHSRVKIFTCFSLLFWKGIVSSSVLCLKTNAPLCDLWGWEGSILWWWFDAGTLISCNIHEISLDQECPLMNQSLCTEFLWFRYQCGVVHFQYQSLGCKVSNVDKACAVFTPYRPYNISFIVNEFHTASISVWWCNISVLFSIQKFVMMFSPYTIIGPTNVILYEVET